jgi:chondroitin-sulfate-ABC endolyase/exolyase
MIKNFTKLLCLSLLSSVANADSGTINRSILTQRTSFEQTEDFSDWKNSGHQLELSAKHFKDGGQSLKWSIANNSALELGPKAVPGITAAAELYAGGQPETYEPSFIPESMQGGIKLWIYREKANPSGQLTFLHGLACPLGSF